MDKTITRVSQLDDWFFEVKMIRAIKSKNYGDPYSAIANLTANGYQMFIDSHLSANNEHFRRPVMRVFTTWLSRSLLPVSRGRHAVSYAGQKQKDMCLVRSTK